ncbi:MAG: hypothetical protein P1U89_21210 [Verrucomicrobiales bacterium]|nr:hypothetical protein [Verrucomicrobiales bacterium]
MSDRILLALPAIHYRGWDEFIIYAIFWVLMIMSLVVTVDQKKDSIAPLIFSGLISSYLIFFCEGGFLNNPYLWGGLIIYWWITLIGKPFIPYLFKTVRIPLSFRNSEKYTDCDVRNWREKVIALNDAHISNDSEIYTKSLPKLGRRNLLPLLSVVVLVTASAGLIGGSFKEVLFTLNLKGFAILQVYKPTITQCLIIGVSFIVSIPIISLKNQGSKSGVFS